MSLHELTMLKSKVYNGAGSRSSIATIEYLTELADSTTGEIARQWNVFCERYAEEMITSGREFMAAFSVQPILQGILKLPYDERTKLITPKMRLRIDGRVLNFAGVWDEGGTHEKIVLWCIEEVES